MKIPTELRRDDSGEQVRVTGDPVPRPVALRRMRGALPELETIVPGHGPMGDGHAAA
ncbi:hypothetical protein ABZ297_19625 [Nonomuraea sp. NPDC005983]|uniref:hypothetical protein n=1 Tax=Nonomuraea sp. NPDC005983 TaxID=3155595 RepID=UPI0033A3A150